MDIIRMSRIDDNTFHVQKTVDKKSKDDGGPVCYCPEQAQRAYAAIRRSNSRVCCRHTATHLHPRSSYRIARLNPPALPGAS